MHYKKQTPLLLPLALLCLTVAALNYAVGTAVGTSTEPEDASTTSKPVTASCNDGNDPTLGDGNNEQAVITGHGQYTGEQKLNVLKHRKDPSHKWQFWMTDYTKNCSHIHFYPDSYEYGSGAEVPLFTGDFKEDIGDGKPYGGRCCYPGTEIPNPNALTVGSDVLAGINKVYAFNEKYYKMNGVDEWGTPIEAFTLSKSPAHNPWESAAYQPSKPNQVGIYDEGHRLTHNLTFYLLYASLADQAGIYRSSTYLETVAHELRHATQFSTWSNADPFMLVASGNEENALEEDFAYLYALAVKNWVKSKEGATLCGSSPCIWTMNEESSTTGTPNTNLDDPNNDESSVPYIFFPDQYPKPKRAMIAAYAFYAASEGLKKCNVSNPEDDYDQCPAGTNAFIDEDFEGLGIDKAFEIFGYVDQEFVPFKIEYKKTKGLSLYKADREWPAKEKEAPYSYQPKETSDEYKVFESAFKAVNIPSDSDDLWSAKLTLDGTSEEVDPNDSTIDFQAIASDECAEEIFNLRAYVDGEPLEYEEGKPIDLDFTMCLPEGGEDEESFSWSDLPIELTDEAGNLKKDIELDVVLWDIYGADRIVSSKTIPVKDTDPNVKQPKITFDHPSSESPDSSTSNPIYKARLEAEASEGVPLNPDGAYFLFKPGPETVDPILVEVSEENCPQVSDKEIVCDTEFEVDSRYNEAEGNVQDPYDNGTADDEGEHQDHTAGLSYVEYGSAPE